MSGLTRESEALLAEVHGTQMALTVFPSRLRAIEAAAARRALERSGVVEALDLAAAKEMLLWVLTFTPEPYTVRRGASAGGEVLWGEPEPGSYTPEHRLESALQLAPYLLRDLATGTALRLAALPRPEEPRVERCTWCGVGRWVTAHDPEAGSRYHPFTPEAR